MPGFPDGMAGPAPGPSPARDGSTHSRPQGYFLVRLQGKALL